MQHPRSALTLHEKELEYLNERLLKLGDDPATEQNWLDFAETQAAEVVTTNTRCRQGEGEGGRICAACRVIRGAILHGHGESKRPTHCQSQQLELHTVCHETTLGGSSC